MIRNDNNKYDFKRINVVIEELSKAKIAMHSILQNINKEYITEFNNHKYFVMKVHDMENQIIDIRDVIVFKNTTNGIELLEEVNDVDEWSLIVDNLEKQLLEYNEEYENIIKCSNYYIGLAENAIQLAEYCTKNDYSKKKVIAHKNLNDNYDYYSLLNPLGLVKDHFFRDLSIYIKNGILNNEFDGSNMEELINNYDFNNADLLILLSKLLFPDKFFMLCNKIIRKKENEKVLLDFNEKYLIYEKHLGNIINTFANKYKISINISWIMPKSINL